MDPRPCTLAVRILVIRHLGKGLKRVRSTRVSTYEDADAFADYTADGNFSTRPHA